MKAGIVGGGIAGRLMALGLLQKGWKVTLFDKNPFFIASSSLPSPPSRGQALGEGSGVRVYPHAPSNCSMVAGGLLTPLSELDKSDLIIFQLGQAALKEYWPNILKVLPEAVDFRTQGSLILAHPKDRNEFKLFIQRIAHAVGQLNACTSLQKADITQLEPEITHFNEGYYFAEEGSLDAQHCMQALQRHLMQLGMEWQMDCVVEDVQPHQINLKHQKHKFDWVFDCRGLGGRSNFSNLRGVRGEIIWLHAPEVNIQRPIRFLHPRYSLYIVPRKNNIYLVGASEIESEDFSPISVKTVLELLTAVYYVHSGFSEARIIHSGTHCRPTLSDHLPQIKLTQGLIALNGLYRHGYLIAPTLIHDILLYLTDGMGAVQYSQLWRTFDDNYSFK